jgi:hypothetical protein
VQPHRHACTPVVPRGALDYAPFAQHGGLGKAYQVFGEQFSPLLSELNEVLAAS